MRERKVFYNLQICRGIAALIVVLAHANNVNKSLFSGFLIVGWNGVDFFFVLSGFIIYYVNFNYIGEPSKFGIYLSRRLIRIFPIYWVYTCAAILLHFAKIKIIGNPLVSWIDMDMTGITKSLLLYPTNVAANEMPVIPVAWTLSFELFFYILFGIVILAGKRILLSIAFLWFVGILLVNIALVKIGNNPLLEMISNSKNLEFFYGCIIAELTLRNKLIKNNILAFALLVLGTSLLLLSWANVAFEMNLYPKIESVIFGIPYSLIIYALVSVETSDLKSALKRFMVYLGDASYSIYLTHYIGIELVRNPLHKLLNNGYIEFFVIVISLTIFGCLCYSFVERPLLQIIKNIRKYKPVLQ